MEFEKTIFQIGSFMPERLEEYLRPEIDVVGCIGIYPNGKKDIYDYLISIYEDIRKKMNEVKSCYLVVELHSLLHVIEVENVNKAKCLEVIKKITNLLCNNFGEKRIIIIKSNIPKYSIMANRLLKKYSIGHDKKEKLKLVQKWEKYICDNTNGILLDITKYYFYYKKIGYLLNDFLYEEECYEDIARKIKGYVIYGK